MRTQVQPASGGKDRHDKAAYREKIPKQLPHVGNYLSAFRRFWLGRNLLGCRGGTGWLVVAFFWRRCAVKLGSRRRRARTLRSVGPERPPRLSWGMRTAI